MIDWIESHRQLLGLAASFAMLAVWIVYLHIFVSSYRRQVRANILINMGAGEGLSAHCLVSNMSAAAIYIHNIILELEYPDRIATCSVTETDGFEDWKKPTDLNLWTRQGPLQPGEVRDMGAFGGMLDHALRSETGHAGPDPAQRMLVQGLRVRIIAVYGSEDLPVAAERRFALRRRQGLVELFPRTTRARQVRSRRQRKQIRRALEQDLFES